ncbi:cytochrome c oxidase subunit II [Haloglomus litoreum]|uniref:cytochrome c oxidase subunit II n=1 Tax=Haloglomus litoreum TaxID=3034026 RepID=UPI0023E7E868|nr:cytochrome c oxidase subunit II transmembrane domain-containing protein [Haloglomus sp. DT116]
MNHRRAVLRAAVGVALLALLGAMPVAAQPSVNIELINNLNEKLLYVAIPIAILVEAILFYTVYKYKDQEEAQPTQENRRLEITWTVATAIILLFVGFAAYQVLGNVAIAGVTAATVDDPEAAQANAEVTQFDGKGAYMPEADKLPGEGEPVQVDVVAQKYFWSYNYVTDDGQNFSTTGTMVIPENRPVVLHVTSIDWLHAFHVPKLGLKQDAFPGHYNTIATTTTLPEGTEEQTYQLYCAEYCGSGHAGMLGKVTVMSEENYEEWQQEQLGGNATDIAPNPRERLTSDDGVPA